MTENLQYRADGRIEWVCEHGIGHTVDADPHYKKLVGEKWNLHGCDGCCAKN